MTIYGQSEVMRDLNQAGEARGIITFYGVVDGPIKLSLWGLQLEGAAGPVLLWIIVVLGLALAARMTWNLGPAARPPQDRTRSD